MLPPTNSAHSSANTTPCSCPPAIERYSKASITLLYKMWISPKPLATPLTATVTLEEILFWMKASTCVSNARPSSRHFATCPPVNRSKYKSI